METIILGSLLPFFNLTFKELQTYEECLYL